MPDDTQEVQEAVEDILVKLYDPEQGLTPDELDADIAYFERKLEHWRKTYKGDTNSEDFKRFTMKTESQLQLLKETRDVFFKNRSESGD